MQDQHSFETCLKSTNDDRNKTRAKGFNDFIDFEKIFEKFNKLLKCYCNN